MWAVDAFPRAGKANSMKIGTVSATLAAVGLLAGCGSSGSASTSSATTPASTAAPASSTASSSAASSFASSGNCLQLAGVASRFAQALQAATSGGKPDLQAAAKAYQDLANAAPSAIQPDLQTISQAFSTFVAALAKSGYTLGQVPTASQAAALQSAAQVFSQSKMRTAEQNVAAWAKQNCTHA
jgi:hypothetical protein